MKVNQMLLTTFVSLFALAGSLFAADDWMTDMEAALERGAKEGKPLFVEFTGSDWCPPCKMMAKEVFSKEEFLEAAKKDFILVKIDVPKGDKELSERNQKVVKKYKVKGFPTVLLLESDEREIGRMQASRFNTVKKMLAELKRQLRIKDMF